MVVEFAEFEIEVHPRSGDSFPCSARSALGGEGRATLRLPFGEPACDPLLSRLAALDTSEDLLAQIGQRLFDALFQGEVKDVYTRSKGGLKPGQGLRIILNIAASEGAVAALPWELLHDPAHGQLALTDTPLVRYLPQLTPTRPLQANLPLRMLLTSAQTPPEAGIARELREVQAALAELEASRLIEIVVEPHLTTQKLQRLLQEEFHIWHFIGHGALDSTGTGRLCFEDATGDSELVSAMQLRLTLNRSSLRLVVLDACESARLATDPQRSIAPALIRAQIPAVIAMQFSVPEETTRAFAGEFYHALAKGLPIDACVTEGRIAVMNATGLGRPDWGIPTVYTHARDGRLFALPHLSARAAGAPAAVLPPTPAPQPRRTVRRAARAARVFISYKRNTRLDEPLAQTLYANLRGAGHDVFIDQKMQVGVDWAREIEQQIEACDYMIVLLSEASVNSEMVAMEVECADRHARRSGKARILPVRVDYASALPYQLSHFLDKIQYTVWRGEPDTAALIEQMLDAIDQRASLPAATPQPAPAAPAASAGPRPYADPRFVESLHEPGGSVRLNSEFYIERDADRRLQREMSKREGTTVTIRAPRQAGKTSLLMRGIAQAQSQGSKVVRVDLQAMDERVTQSLDACLRYLAEVIFRSLRLDSALVERAWQSSLGAPDKTTYLIEDHVLSAGANVVLAIDEADRLLSAPFHDNFFGLLRFWHNNRAMSEQWDNLDILMVISTEPHLLISDVSQSPFNVGTKIVLPDFTPQQVAELNRRYRSPLGDAQLPELADLLGGHPYLTSRALYTLVDEDMSWDRLSAIATTHQSPFHDHLKRYLWLLRDKPELIDALRQIMARGRCPDEVAFYRLMQAGLVQGADSQACACRCKLYERYLKDKL